MSRQRLHWDDVEGKPDLSGVGPPAWAAVTGKPATFTPSAHSHSTAEVAGLDAALTGKVSTGDPRLTDARAPLAHTHPESEVTNLVADLAAKVPATRTVAGKALNADVALVKADVGLGNVDNTSDANKPASTAQQTAMTAAVVAHAALADPHPIYALDTDLAAYQPISGRGVPLGYAGLDVTGKVPAAQLPTQAAAVVQRVMTGDAAVADGGSMAIVGPVLVGDGFRLSIGDNAAVAVL